MLVLENLTHRFSKPNVLDIKLGTQLFDEDASLEKQERMRKAAEASTSAQTGVRLTGFQVSAPHVSGVSARSPSSSRPGRIGLTGLGLGNLRLRDNTEIIWQIASRLRPPCRSRTLLLPHRVTFPCPFLRVFLFRTHRNPSSAAITCRSPPTDHGRHYPTAAEDGSDTRETSCPNSRVVSSHCH